MIGRSIDVLVPEPISSVHSALVQKWITTGNDRLVNSGSRYLIGQHRAGHLFPIKANVRSAGDIFVVVCEEVSRRGGEGRKGEGRKGGRRRLMWT